MPIALVTGATSALGAAFVRHLAGLGYDLAIVSKDRALVDRLDHELTSSHQCRPEVIVADLADPKSRKVVVDRLGARERPIDLLVNNAEVSAGGKFWEVDYDTVRRQFELNVTAAMELTHAVLPAMLTRGAGQVIMVSSVAGLVPQGRPAYSGERAYLISLSEGLARHLRGSEVRVMAFCPGAMRARPLAGLVAVALADLDRNAVVSVPGARSKGMAAAARLLPRRFIRWINVRASLRRSPTCRPR